MTKLMGKAKQKDRWAKKKLKDANEVLMNLSRQIQAYPCKDGSILCFLGSPKEGNIRFHIRPEVVLEAAEARKKFAEELKTHIAAGAGATEINERVNEAATLPIGGQ